MKFDHCDSWLSSYLSLDFIINKQQSRAEFLHQKFEYLGRRLRPHKKIDTFGHPNIFRFAPLILPHPNFNSFMIRNIFGTF